MNRPLLRRIFAIIALVGIVGVTVFGTLTFFNLFNEAYAPTFGTLAVAFACVTAVFFILAYILRPKEPTDMGIPEESGEPAAGESPDVSVPGGEAGDGEGDVDDDHDVEPDGNGHEEGEG